MLGSRLAVSWPLRCACLALALGCTPAVQQEAGPGDQRGAQDAATADSQWAPVDAHLADHLPDVADREASADEGGAPADAASMDGVPADATGLDLGTPDARPAECPALAPASPTCHIVDVNGLPASSTLLPGDLVTLSALPLFTAPAPQPAAVHWRIVEAPPLSRVSLWPVDSASTTLMTQPADRSFQYQQGVDQVGRYVLEATAQGDGGSARTVSCELTVAAPPGLYIEISREVAAAALELALVRRDAAGRYCLPTYILEQVDTAEPAQACANSDGQAETCFLGNCTSYSAAWPDWDGDDVHGSAGDPRIVWMDQPAQFPLAVQLAQPGPGTYLVGASLRGFAPPSPDPLSVEFRVFVDGALLASAPVQAAWRQLVAPLAIVWPAAATDGPCVTTLADARTWCRPASSTDPSACSAAAFCGPGTYCDEVRARCVLRRSCCEDDSRCGAGRACVPASHTCASTWCHRYRRCPKLDQVCTVDTLSCSEVVAPCEGTEEPNDTLESARSSTAAQIAGTLCRGDDDFFHIPVRAGTRLVASVELLANAFVVEGTEVALFDMQGQQLQLLKAISQTSLRLSTNVATDGERVLALRGRATALQVLPYTVDLEQTPAILCDVDLGEPNDSHSEASALGWGSHELVLCGAVDVDHYVFTVPARQQLRATLSYDPSCGQLAPRMLTTSGEDASAELTGMPGEWQLRHLAGDVEERLIVRVERQLHIDDDQPYQLKVEAANCQDGHEPNDLATQARVVGSGTHVGHVCDNTDVDYFALETEIDGSLRLDLTASGPGSVRCQLLEDTGALLDAIDTGGVQDTPISLSRTGLHGQRYLLRLGPGDGAGSTDRTAYALDLAVAGRVDGGVPACGDPTEPNDDPTTPTALSSGMVEGSLCWGTDVDYYRVQLANAARLQIMLVAATSSEFRVDLLDATGQLLAHSVASGPGQEIATAALPQGAYLLKVFWSGVGAEPIFSPYDLFAVAQLVLDAGAED